MPLPLSLCPAITYAFASLWFFPAPIHLGVPIAPAWLPAQQTPQQNAQPSRFNDIANAQRR